MKVVGASRGPTIPADFFFLFLLAAWLTRDTGTEYREKRNRKRNLFLFSTVFCFLFSLFSREIITDHRTGTVRSFMNQRAEKTVHRGTTVCLSSMLNETRGLAAGRYSTQHFLVRAGYETFDTFTTFARTLRTTYLREKK